MITAPMVLLIVGITFPRPIVERESWGRSSEGGGQGSPKLDPLEDWDVEMGKKGSGVGE
jgi:hypothetical protein